MTQLDQTLGDPAVREAPVHAHARHPTILTIQTGLLVAVLSLLGAIVGIQLLVTLGVTPNTSIIGALVAMLIARVPLRFLATFRSIHVQNLAQSAISSATFGAANSVLLPIAIPYVMGRPDLILPMFAGVGLALILDGYLLYRMFGTSVFPATGAWPPGVAAAEAIKAGDVGGKQAGILGVGVALGLAGAWWGIPMSALGVAFIGNIWAMSMFGLGLLARGYSNAVAGWDIAAAYVPHGMMVGAGLFALVQVAMALRRKSGEGVSESGTASRALVDARADIGGTLAFGGIAYVAIAVLLAIAGGLYAEMSLPMLLGFVLFAAFAAYVHELIVGIAAMHSGWFPAFAVALITLLFGMFLGFPLVALILLCGFSAATGPAFADMGYDLKAGFILRGNGRDPDFEMDGRRQQWFASLFAFLIAIPVVWFAHDAFFEQDLVPPIVRVYAATINAGVTPEIATSMLLWAIPGALVQWIGGPKRQIGVLLATGLLINFPIAAWTVLFGIAVRILIERFGKPEHQPQKEVVAAGMIAGDALYGFFNSMFKVATK
ncbi:MAG: OPT/YSL family transporter [Rhizobiaceae bacterium]